MVEVKAMSNFCYLISDFVFEFIGCMKLTENIQGQGIKVKTSLPSTVQYVLKKIEIKMVYLRHLH